MMVGGKLFTSDEFGVLLGSVDVELQTLTTTFEACSSRGLDAKLRALADKIVTCKQGIELSENPIARAKNAKALKRIEENYQTVATGLRSRSTWFGVVPFGYYDSLTDARMAAVARPLPEDTSLQGIYARAIKEAAARALAPMRALPK